MRPNLYIVRGLPGSGKSTFAKSLGCVVFEADMFFQRQGENRWLGNQLKNAHSWCLDNTHRCLVRGIDVAVANVFSTYKDMRPYLDFLHMANVSVHRMTGGFKSIHNVPEKTLQKMRLKFQDYEGEFWHETNSDWK